MIRTTNVRDGWVDTSTVRYVQETTFEKWTRRLRPRRGDVILTREAPLGEVGMLRSDDAIFLGQRLVMFRADQSVCDARFLTYAMLGPAVQAELRRLGSGSTVEHLRVPDCSSLPILTPPLAVQRQIGDVLGGIDELIENNRRRVEVLETMARAIYREWFVHFRFPGHENVTLVDSPLGPLPRDWTATVASSALQINPKIRSDESTHYPFVTMGDLSTMQMVCYPSEIKVGGSGAKFMNGDTLFARITPCLENGKTGFVQCLEEGEVGRGSTEFIVLRGRLVGGAFTYCLARSDEFRNHAMKSMSGASGRQRVRNECFENFHLAVPPIELSDRFEKTVRTSFSGAHSLTKQNRLLGKLRDRLLPKLVTGRIDVTSLDLDALVGSTVP